MDDDKEFDIHTKIEKIGDGHMTYQTAMEHIADIGKTGSILGLTAVKELLDRLGNPQDQLQVIHVAGTNGKGSICTFLESMYRAEGKRVGRYISPTLYGYLERFQIDGVWMTEDGISGAVEDERRCGCDTDGVRSRDSDRLFIFCKRAC